MSDTDKAADRLGFEINWAKSYLGDIRGDEDTEREQVLVESCDKLIAEVERLRDGEPSLNGVGIRAYEKKFESLQVELEKLRGQLAGMEKEVDERKSRNGRIAIERDEYKSKLNAIIDLVKKNDIQP